MNFNRKLESIKEDQINSRHDKHTWAHHRQDAKNSGREKNQPDALPFTGAMTRQMADFAAETTTVRRWQKESLVTLKACQPGCGSRENTFRRHQQIQRFRQTGAGTTVNPPHGNEHLRGPHAGGETPELQRTAGGARHTRKGQAQTPAWAA